MYNGHRRTGLDREREANQNCPESAVTEGGRAGLEVTSGPQIWHLFRWMLSYQRLFSLKIHLICPESQFSLTPGGGGCPPWPPWNKPMWMKSVDDHINWTTEGDNNHNSQKADNNHNSHDNSSLIITISKCVQVTLWNPDTFENTDGCFYTYL